MKITKSQYICNILTDLYKMFYGDGSKTAKIIKKVILLSITLTFR